MMNYEKFFRAAKEGIKDVAIIGTVIGIGVLSLLTEQDKTYEVVEAIADNKEDIDKAYVEAINAVAKSEMWSSDKKAVYAAIKTDGTVSYYKRVAAIASDRNMWSKDIVECIKLISK